MASTSGKAKGRGGRREGSGRKRKYGNKADRREAQKAWQKSHRRIYLETNIFQSWLHAKFLAGFETCSDNAFAAHLLTQELLRRSSEDVLSLHVVDSSSSSNRRRKARNPRKHVRNSEEKENEGPQNSKSDDIPSDPISVVKSPIADCDTRDSDSSSLSDLEIVVD